MAVGTAAFAAYLSLSASVAGDGDSAELALVLIRNGVAHPTGYPTYVMLGHWFVVLTHRLGTTWDYAANAWSALGGGFAMGLMHALAARMSPPEVPWSGRARSLAALFPVGIFALNPVWTGVTTQAEVYSWQQAWVMGTVLLFVGILRSIRGPRHPAGSNRSEDSGRRWVAVAAGWGLLCGLGATHHATSALTVTTLSLALLIGLARTRRLRPELIAIALLAGLIPLAGYASLLIRGRHSGHEIWIWFVPTWSGLWTHMTAAQYRGFLGHSIGIAAGQRRFLASYVFPYLTASLGLLALLALRTRDGLQRSVYWALIATAGLQTAFGALYGVSDPAAYFLPPLAIGLSALVPLGYTLASRLPRRPRILPGIGLALALVVLAHFGPYLKIGNGRRELLVRLDGHVRDLWRSIPVDRGIVLWGGDRLHQYQLLRGERLGLHVVRPSDFAVPISQPRFVERFGFDPFRSHSMAPGGARIPAMNGPAYYAFVEDLAHRLNRATHEPVILLSQASDSLRVIDGDTVDAISVPAPTSAR